MIVGGLLMVVGIVLTLIALAPHPRHAAIRSSSADYSAMGTFGLDARPSPARACSS